MLKFQSGNGKLDPAIAIFNIPAGYSCPGARDCHARAVKTDDGWKIKDGKDTEFRCYAASEEARYPNVRDARWHNFDLLKNTAKQAGKDEQAQVRAMAQLLVGSLPARKSPFDGISVGGRTYKHIVRVHSAGDYFSQVYFDAWVLACQKRPDVLAYGYTKSLPYWVARLGVMPQNLVLTASLGGRYDAMIRENGLRSARVVFTEQEAADLGLEIDHDDSHAMRRGGDFALIIHGAQPAKSPAAKAVAALRAGGDFGYGKIANKRRRVKENARFALTVL